MTYTYNIGGVVLWKLEKDVEKEEICVRIRRTVTFGGTGYVMY